MNQQLKNLSLDSKNLFVFDFDGTLTEARFSKNAILDCPNDDRHLLKNHLSTDVYKDIKPIPLMQNFLKTLNDSGNEIKILTHTHDGIEVIQKLNYIKKHFPYLNPDETLIGVSSSEYKKIVLRDFSSPDKKIIYVDDSLNILIDLESSDILNLYCFHISSVFV